MKKKKTKNKNKRKFSRCKLVLESRDNAIQEIVASFDLDSTIKKNIIYIKIVIGRIYKNISII